MPRDGCTVENMRFLAVFSVVALLEMATFFWVESRIGLGWALGLALATAFVGSLLVRRAGLSVLSRFQQRLGEGRLPGRELSHGGAILVAGAFLISPGFITDVLGFLLLVPAIRDLIHTVVSRRLSTRVGVLTTGRRRQKGDRPGGSGHGEVIDVDSWE